MAINYIKRFEAPISEVMCLSIFPYLSGEYNYWIINTMHRGTKSQSAVMEVLTDDEVKARITKMIQDGYKINMDEIKHYLKDKIR